MGRLRRFFRESARAFLPVNPTAGKLRTLLFLLSIFIFWTTIAQMQTIPTSGLVRFQSEDGFITTILRDLAVRYFHPITLGITAAPVLIVFISLRLVSISLADLARTDTPNIKHYLTRCAFGRRPMQTAIKPELTDSPKTMDTLTQLGGPASLTIAPGMMIIIQSGISRRYLLLQGNDTGDTTITLEHKQLLTAVIPVKDLQFSHQHDSIRSLYQFTIMYKNTSDGSLQKNVKMQPLSACDVQFLMSVVQSRKSLGLLIDTIIETFLSQQASIEPQVPHEERAASSQREKQPLKTHDNYTQTVKHFLPKRQGFSRPRSHKRYAPSMTNPPACDAGKDFDNVFSENTLEATLLRELQSFYNLKHINISLLVKDKSK